MIDALSTTLTSIALGAALWALVLLIAGKPLEYRRWHGLGVLGVLTLLELGLLVQAVAGFVKLFGTDRELEKLTFAGYLVGALVVLPLAVFWALAERTRWGPGVLVIGSLAIPVLILRLGQIWNANA
ncbi:MAG TPA: hypothetical protein VGP26_12705 [Actinophytocola sp.]|nr:hypothetical protein [Actinophytocola sp.]